MNENTFMMCPNFIYLILQVLEGPKVSKILINHGLFACLFNCNSNRNSHKNLRIVTCAR